jgi:hypothetical protein
MAAIRPYRNLKIWDIEAFAQTNWDDLEVLRKIKEELNARKTDRAQRLFGTVLDRIQELSPNREMKRESPPQNREMVCECGLRLQFPETDKTLKISCPSCKKAYKVIIDDSGRTDVRAWTQQSCLTLSAQTGELQF